MEGEGFLGVDFCTERVQSQRKINVRQISKYNKPGKNNSGRRLSIGE